ncbi:MAG: hypothetical protein LC635_00585 [Pseudonocardiaceae bacterium]|nr:hypothetical protein [Pseudonocardiaceae bacterium]
MLDPQAAAAAAADLAARSADTALVRRIREADPDDTDTVAAAAVAVADFHRAVQAVADIWASGMGFGEAALGHLDLTGSGLGLEAARLALEAANLTAVGELAVTIRRLLSPAIDTPLPAPGAIAGSAIDVGLGLVGQLTGQVQAWDATAIGTPIQQVLGLALDPLAAATRAVETVGTEVAAAIRAVRAVVDELDLAPVADAIRRVLAPVVDALGAIEGAVATAEDTLRTVCEAITGGLGEVAGSVEEAANTVRDALAPVRTTLAGLDLTGLTERLRAGLTSVASALAAAQLSPYFDAAIDVIDTTAGVIDAVPFGLLPTDVQQEIVDVGRPIKQLDLQELEDELRGGLAEITDSLQADALDALEQAHGAVVAFLTTLDPGPRLAELETGPLAQLRAIVEQVDPEALLAPVADALGRFRSLLDGLDLAATVIEPLEQALAPVAEAVAALDPAELLSGVVEQIAQARQVVSDLLHLDDAETALAEFRDRVTALLARLDPVGLAQVLDQAVAQRLRQPEPGPPAGVVGSLVAGLAQATGLDTDEAGVAEALRWIGGVDGAAVVRARLDSAATALRGTRDGVQALDPVPLVAAAQAQRRALVEALANHPPDSGLRTVLDPLLAGRPPAEVLGPLVENRQRYLVRLEGEATLAATLAASGRSEVTAAATGLRAALVPLDAIPARLRAVLAGLGLATVDQPFTDILAHLLETAGPERLVPALADLVDAARAKALQALDAVLAPATETVATVRALLAAFDLGPVLAELVALHGQVAGQIAALGPRALLGDVLDAAEDTVAKLTGFDPLGPVREVLDTAQLALRRVLDTARPTVVFADAVAIHAELVGLAAGLDVRALLAPVLAALDSLAGQLDAGFDRTGDALARLQAALPDAVTDPSISGGVEVSF